MISVQETAEDSVKVTLIPMVAGMELKPATFATKLIHGHRLSPDCGHQFFRCQHLLFTQTSQASAGSSEYIVFVPLQNGLLLLELHHSIQNSQMEFGSFQILDSSRCNPTAVFKIYNSFYTMCTDLQNQYISVYEVRLNGTLLQQAQLLGPLTELSSEYLSGFASSDVVNTSGFLLYTDIPHQPLIYFAIDNYLFAIAPLDYSIYDEFNAIGTNCRHIYHIVKASKSQLLVYCSREYVYYDTELQYWLSEHTYENSGVPYLCPDQSYGLTVYNDYLEYRIGSQEGTILDVDFDSGLCFNGSTNENIFTYIDKTADSIHFINLTSPSQIPAVPSFTVRCANVDCIPLLFVGDRYLVIQQAEGEGIMMVLDVNNELRPAITLAHQTPSLVTILQDKVSSSIDRSTRDDNTNLHSSGRPTVIVLCVILPISFLVSAVVLSVLLFLRHQGVIGHKGNLYSSNQSFCHSVRLHLCTFYMQAPCDHFRKVRSNYVIHSCMPVCVSPLHTYSLNTTNCYTVGTGGSVIGNWTRR